MNSNYLFHQRMNAGGALRTRQGDENMSKANTSVIGIRNEDYQCQREFGKDITNTVNEGGLPLFARKSLENKENLNRNSFIDTKVKSS
jgi:hypothetical protein